MQNVLQVTNRQELLREQAFCEATFREPHVLLISDPLVPRNSKPGVTE